eukprot:1186350-Prorocentrum_minimum.AAC.2
MYLDLGEWNPRLWDIAEVRDPVLGHHLPDYESRGMALPCSYYLVVLRLTGVYLSDTSPPVPRGGGDDKSRTPECMGRSRERLTRAPGPLRGRLCIL